MNREYTDEEIRRIIRKKKRRRRWARRSSIVVSCLLIIGLTVVLASIVGSSVGNKRYQSDIATHSVDVSGNSFVDTALSQATAENKGGRKFWSNSGFSSRVPWCAAFVTWCAEQNDMIEDGKLIEYVGCGTGAEWFKSKGRWLEGGKKPKGGYVIFFSWQENRMYDHTGIVTGVVGDYVFTIEGNSSDRCRRKRYRIDNPVIKGYGIIE